jgi:RHS repeat-associated protein
MRRMTKLLMLLCLLVVGHSAFAQSTGTVTYVYTDPQGTPLAEADASGNITATFDYTPYGTTALGNPPNGPGYTGHVNDPETNLVYMQARYYDPATGRFLSSDPESPRAGNTFNFGRYTYTNDNPVVGTDPTGKQCAQCLYSPNDSLDHQASINAGASKIGLAVTAAVAPLLPAAGLVGATGLAVTADTIATGSLVTAATLNGEGVIASGVIVADAVAAANGLPSAFGPEALVVRGGAAANQTAEKIDAAIGPSRESGITGFSCQCNGGADLSELGANLYNKQVGVTTVGEIQQAGGNVIATPGGGYHATVTDINGASASPLFKIMDNPNPKQQQ